jgi:hypothetical protein
MSLPVVFRNILLVAGTGRNTGKTTLACRIITHFSQKTEIIGLKITSIYPDENSYHGCKYAALTGNFEICEEAFINPNKDTYRMKQAGASRVFFIRAKDDWLAEAMDAFFQQIDCKSIIICESASLRNFIQPGIFLMIRSNNEFNIKERARKLFPLADFLIPSEKIDFDIIIHSIGVYEKGWMKTSLSVAEDI